MICTKCKKETSSLHYNISLEVDGKCGECTMSEIPYDLPSICEKCNSLMGYFRICENMGDEYGNDVDMKFICKKCIYD